LSVTVEKVRPQLEVSVQQYRNGDEERIVSFLQRCMSWPSVKARVPALDHWRWKYLANPLGFQLVCLAEQGGEMVSHSASIPVMLRIGKRTVLASQGVDLCTDPGYRGHGIIGQTMVCRNQMKDEHGVELDFGFPNHAAYRLSLLKQGFTDLGVRVMQHRFIANEGRFFKKVRYGQIKRIGYDSYMLVRRSLRWKTHTGNEYVLSHEDRFGPEVDGLYREAAEGFDLMVAREHHYLNWRYADPRGGDFIIRTARRDGRLVGYMVHKLEDRDGTSCLNVVDALVIRDGEPALAALLSDVIVMAQAH
jgi:hypothetical protein